jgi:NAD(P)-dependent dehydrogenase (short-subunit alcohol dehydrogenase family)
MTGATSGIGAAALEQLAREPQTLVIVGVRVSGPAVPAGVETLPMDLTSLDSVREFAEAGIRRLKGTPIDALVLNAGTQARSLDGRTADGFETTFGSITTPTTCWRACSHPHLAVNARVILTTSDTHDPAITPLAPKSLDPTSLAYPPKSGFGASMRAYAALKLCNLLTARSRADSPQVREHKITVLAYNSGFTGGTNLGDPSPRAERFMSLVVFPAFKIIGRFKPACTMGRPERAGQVLAQLTTGQITPPPGHMYRRRCTPV